MPFYVYILSSKRNGPLYVGITNDMLRRLEEHKAPSHDGFTKKYTITNLVHIEEFTTAYDAIEREKCIRRWKRSWKTRLIEEHNPEWNDLSHCLAIEE